MTADPISEPACDRCGKPRFSHAEITGLGRVCPISGNTFDTSKSTSISTLKDRVRRLEEALQAFVVLERSIKIDIGLTHKGRLNTASDLAIEFDADFRRELEEAFNIARTALGEPQC